MFEYCVMMLMSSRLFTMRLLMLIANKYIKPLGHDVLLLDLVGEVMLTGMFL